MNKFDRNYKFFYEDDEGITHEVDPPFTLEFDIKRSTYSSANESSIRIYNLSSLNRQRIRKDLLAPPTRTASLYAGYGTTIPLIFTGKITQAWSVREGVDWISEIDCFDGGLAFQQAFFNQSIPGGTPTKDAFFGIISTLGKYGVKQGYIGNYTGTYNKDTPYCGSTIEIIRELTGGGFYIDNGAANCLPKNEVLPTQQLILDATAGLIGTPVRERYDVRVDFIFEPRVTPGQQVTLQSFLDASFNGPYKVMALHHRGTISGAVCGDAVTTLTLRRIGPGGIIGG